MHKPKIIAIVGPTASGKSALGIFLAQKLRRLPAGRQGEIISADSRQVYKGLDIGTGKVTKKEMAGISHHLLDVASPKKVFTVDDFIKKASATITTIYGSGHTPIIVGGTGLYIDALLGRISIPSVPPNEELRTQLEKKSATTLLKILQRLDPERAETVDQKNPRRLVRAIEIARAIGKTPPKKIEEKYEILWLGLNPSDQVLKKNIHTRLLVRMKLGMVAEAKRLHAQGLSYKRMRELGLEYRYLAMYLQDTLTRGDFEIQLERAIWHYAKRQRTWFKRNQEIHWIKNKTEALRLAKGFLSR
ncbi:MAG TPA: tRNA (adenosine(37)-N6)-dimethylallyltransferase MiaA [Candidatus Paceibacterota bacterium]|nr:tRNA (adenosine(37)-N6)-dimethylallyltransferase MiaA [Candidatus Paceibacterota bacterium]